MAQFIRRGFLRAGSRNAFTELHNGQNGDNGDRRRAKSIRRGFHGSTTPRPAVVETIDPFAPADRRMIISARNAGRILRRPLHFLGQRDRSTRKYSTLFPTGSFIPTAPIRRTTRAMLPDSGKKPITKRASISRRSARCLRHAGKFESGFLRLLSTERGGARGDGMQRSSIQFDTLEANSANCSVEP